MKVQNILFLSLLFFIACEDPIDVRLDDAEQQTVVDAWLDNSKQRQEIRISQTLPYFTAEFTPGVENATVTVTRNDGSLFNFEHEADGVYVYNVPQGETLGSVGDQFELTVSVDNDMYTANAEIYRVPEIDSLVQEFRENEVFTDDGIYCQVFARDFEGLGDTYWIKSYRNGQFLNRPFEINLAYDAGFDSGGEVDGFVFIYPIRDLVNEVDTDGIPQPWEVGDDIRVEIHSISNDAFSFLEIMRDQLLNSFNGIFAEPLANTKGNIVHANGDKTVLGVFNVSAVSAVEATIE